MRIAHQLGALLTLMMAQLLDEPPSLSVKRAEKIACAGNLRYDYGHVIFDP